MTKKIVKKILIDTDVIFHFCTVKKLKELSEILLPYTIIILDIVYEEATKDRKKKTFIDNWINISKGSVNRLPFNSAGFEARQEYAKIKKNNPIIGNGERACMAFAKYRKDIIASSNFRDIVPYCFENDIEYLGTLDILVHAFNKGIFTEEICDTFISVVKEVNKARFPKGVNSLNDYRISGQCRDLSILD